MKGCIVVELSACRNACLFCGSSRDISTISDQEMQKIERNFLKHAIELKNGGFDEVELSGVDPVEHPQIASFVKLLRNKLGFRKVQLSTHGRNLENAALVDDLRLARLTDYRIPLYGITAEVHESVTQGKGSFAQTLQGIKNIRSNHPEARLVITSQLMRQNTSEVLDVFRLAASYADSVVYSIPCISNVEKGRMFALSYDELRPLVLQLLDEAARLKKSLSITDVPFCVTGKFQKELVNKTGPAPMAVSYQVPEAFRTE